VSEKLAGAAGRAAGAGTVHRLLQPAGWPEPKGYANGISASGRTVFTGGLVGWDEDGRFPPDFSGQLRQTLVNTLAVLAAAGAGPEHIVRMTWYVTDMDAYLGARRSLGPIWRELFGAIYPPMAVIGVSRLVEKAALVEIETTAVIPEADRGREP
jgi:enamine deaminase RidA (YjgF/YER057c/UK114 family)